MPETSQPARTETAGELDQIRAEIGAVRKLVVRLENDLGELRERLTRGQRSRSSGRSSLLWRFPFRLGRNDSPEPAPGELPQGAPSFLRALYIGLLGRDPDPAGFAHQLEFLSGAASRNDVIRFFTQSEEFTNRLRGALEGDDPDSVPSERFVAAAYRVVLGRAADAEGSSVHRRNLDDGMSRESLLVNLVKSPEFAKRSVTRGENVLVIDDLVVVGPNALFVSGSSSGFGERIPLNLVSGDGTRREIGERLYWIPSSATAGSRRFVGFLQEPSLTSEEPRVRLEIGGTGGERGSAEAPEMTRDPFEGRRRILRSFGPGSFDESLIADHVHPALELLTRRCQQEVAIRRVWTFGEPPANPEISIIIPLYRRLDFLEHQLAQFAADDDVRNAELIYVLDSPEHQEELRALAHQLSLLYRLSLKVVVMERNAGYAAANNAGVQGARGRLLLLLNSDVFPDRRGWLSAMVRFHDSRPRLGALGAKLLYDDGSLQHAGMYFGQAPTPYGLWHNLHYFKGLPRGFPAANVARAVPAVTGACLLIDGRVFEQLGGFRQCYIQGDFEDSDLCLRCLEAGFENWYLPEAELYHLERQSYVDSLETDWGRNATLYNCWLHTRLWRSQIESVMARRDFAL